MKITFAIFVTLICTQLFACNNTTRVVQPKNDNFFITDTSKVKITIGSISFTATLTNNASAKAFKAMLPVTIKMDELNGNEKFFYFSTNLPVKAAIGDNINVGDLMLFGNNCLVLFYKSFNSSYSYTRLGSLDNTSGLVTALGADSVTVRFENQ
jgi:hypothetical protein